MKTRFLIIGGLALTSAGIWYLFCKNRALAEPAVSDPVDSKKPGESGAKHMRQVFHKAKEFVPETAI